MTLKSNKPINVRFKIWTHLRSTNNDAHKSILLHRWDIKITTKTVQLNHKGNIDVCFHTPIQRSCNVMFGFSNILKQWDGCISPTQYILKQIRVWVLEQDWRMKRLLWIWWKRAFWEELPKAKELGGKTQVRAIVIGSRNENQEPSVATGAFLSYENIFRPICKNEPFHSS